MNGWTSVLGNRTRVWTVRRAPAWLFGVRVRRVRFGSQPSNESFELERTVYSDGRYGWNLTATKPIEPKTPVVLGPIDKVNGGDFAWDAVRIEAGWPEDMAIIHKRTGQVFHNADAPREPIGFPLLLSSEQVEEYGLHHATRLLPDGRILLDVDDPHAPNMPWRVTGAAPPAGMPLWYFMDHCSQPNIRIAPNLCKIDDGHGGSRSAIVFMSKRFIQRGEKLTYFYEQHPPEWCPWGCPGCFA